MNESDYEFLMTASKGYEAAFVAVVHEDVSFTPYVLGDPDVRMDIVVSKLVSAPRRGIFATLLGGFWFVKDRLKQPHMDRAIESAVRKMDIKCQAATRVVGDSKFQIDEDDLPPIQDSDYFQLAIETCEKYFLDPDRPIDDRLVGKLRSASMAEPAIKACFKRIAGAEMHGFWTGHRTMKGETWAALAETLRACRSNTTIAKARLRTELVLPQLVDANTAEDYLNWLSAEQTECSDLQHILMDVGDVSKIHQQDSSQVLTFAAQALSKLTRAPCFMLYNVCAFCLAHVPFFDTL